MCDCKKHSVYYVIGRRGKPICAECYPPGRATVKIGLLTSQGLRTSADTRQSIRRFNELGRHRELWRELEPFGLDSREWEIISPETGEDGWPIDSRPWE